jgi:hypothetical protein
MPSPAPRGKLPGELARQLYLTRENRGISTAAGYRLNLAIPRAEVRRGRPAPHPNKSSEGRSALMTGCAVLPFTSAETPLARPSGPPAGRRRRR